MQDTKQIEIKLDPESAHNREKIENQLAGIVTGKLSDWRIKKRSIDARNRRVNYLLIIEYLTDGQTFNTDVFQEQKPALIKKDAPSALIVGFGPAGMFAAIELLNKGIKPIVIERGKAVRERRRDLAAMNKEGIVNPESNYCFGEGGAGTYSDGKLYTRSGKRGPIDKVLHLFVEHGADPDIMINARPHIGTNKLPQIIENMRAYILNQGGEIRFNTKLTDFFIEDNKIKSLTLNNEEQLICDYVILATGHSARDIYELLATKKVLIYAKPFALGVRIEHPQSLIDKLQYHCEDRGVYLPPAYYSLVTQAQGRGVFSFCMCPGGIIAPAATAPGEIVVNGWSPSKRNGKFANSGMVVAVDEQDWKQYDSHHALAALKFQQAVEQKAFAYGGGKLVAPAQRMMDFINHKHSQDLPECSYLPGIKSSNLHEILPLAVSKALQAGLQDFAKKMKGYGTNDAVLLATESRTSSPVRIPREKEALHHPEILNLFPCGEGAGYAGGIVSAAIDGMRCAQQIAMRINNPSF